MSIIDKLIENNNTVFKTVRAKITKDLEVKIKFICEKTGVKEDEYLGMILEDSEIAKVHKELLKKEKSTVEIDEQKDINQEN